jgi:hypothetical protein
MRSQALKPKPMQDLKWAQWGSKDMACKDDVWKRMFMQTFWNGLLKMIHPLFENCSKGEMQAYATNGKRSWVNLKWIWFELLAFTASNKNNNDLIGI